MTVTNIVNAVRPRNDGNDGDKLKRSAIQRFTRLHGAMYGEISSMLRRAKLAPMEALQAHEPSFTQMAVELEEYLGVLVVLSQMLDLEEHVITHATEYLLLIKKLASAIEVGDPELLGEAIAALDEKPYI
ncbi:TPA: hypothetical protein AB5A43_003368 [Vibrio cholerae]